MSLRPYKAAIVSAALDDRVFVDLAAFVPARRIQKPRARMVLYQRAANVRPRWEWVVYNRELGVMVSDVSLQRAYKVFVSLLMDKR